MEKIHTTSEYLLNPYHKIKIIVIGCGGNGSLMVSRLARINYALEMSNKLGLEVVVYDDDVVEEYNVGRQMFGIGDIGENKAFTICSKINRNFNTNFRAVQKKYNFQESANIYISCVDNADFRIEFDSFFKKSINTKDSHKKSYYWFDLGNSKNIGQCVVGSADIPQADTNGISTLPTIIDLFGNIKEQDIEEIQGVGCSTFNDKLNEQNLFINDNLTALSSHLLWEILSNGFISKQGFFVNLDTFNTNPIALK